MRLCSVDLLDHYGQLLCIICADFDFSGECILDSTCEKRFYFKDDLLILRSRVELMLIHITDTLVKLILADRKISNQG